MNDIIREEELLIVDDEPDDANVSRAEKLKTEIEPSFITRDGGFPLSDREEEEEVIEIITPEPT